MSWLQKYNNFLFAFFGTLIFIAILLSFLGSSIIGIAEFFLDRNAQSPLIAQEESSSERPQEMAETKKARNLVSFRGPFLFTEGRLDLTLVPVIRKEQKDPGSSDFLSLSRSVGKRGSFSIFSGNRFTDLSNLLIKDGDSQRFRPLLQENAYIAQLDIVTQLADTVLVYFVATNDTNGDGRLTARDRLQLRINNLKANLEFEADWDFISSSDRYTALPDTDFIVIPKKIDYDGDGEFSNDREPTELISINVTDGEQGTYLDPKLVESLQDLLN